MDSIRTLMENNQYDLVIKLTENATDMDGIFYRIGALLAVGKAEDALICLTKNKKILQKQLFLLIRMHIDLLCLLLRFDEAFDALEYYRELPYDSQEVEELIKSLPKYIREQEKAVSSRKEISVEEIHHGLKSLNKEQVLNYINLALANNVYLFIEDFQNILRGFPSQAIRSYALLGLVQQHVNQEFKFSSKKGMISVNPIKLVPPFIDQEFDDLTKRIRNEFKNPSLSENAIRILSSYIIQIYPSSMDFDEDYLIGVLYYLASETLQIKLEKDKYDYCLDRHLSIDKFNEIYDILFNSLNEN